MQNKPRKKLKILFFTAACLLILATLWKYIPYQSTLEGKIRNALEENGIKVKSLTVEKINNKQASFININLNEKPTINIQKLTINYSLQDLLTSRFYSNSDVNLKAENINIDQKPYNIILNNLSAVAKGEKGTWKGSAQTMASITGLPEEIPQLIVKADYIISRILTTASVSIYDEAKEYTADMIFNLPENGEGTVQVKYFQLPWSGGVVSIKDTLIQGKMDKPVSFNVILKDVNLSSMLGKISDGKIEGEGKLNGEIPITYYPDGSITIDKGTVFTKDSGNIKIEPSLIPGKNSQIEFARATLSNFHYTTLKISVSSDKKEKSLINLTLEGKNPEMEDERPVKLNINLDGDIIPLLQQSLLPINDFRQYLKDTK